MAFTGLGTVFDYPDVLKQPAGDVLASFRESQGVVSAWFLALALGAAMLAPVAVGVGRLSDSRLMRWAVPVGIAAAVVQVVGLLRWPLLVPGWAAAAAGGDPAAAADARAAFGTANRVLGNLIGETGGYMLTAAWTALVLAALGTAFAGRWFVVLGAVSAVLVLAGVLSPLDLPVIDMANFVGYVLWSLWLIAFAVVLLVRQRRRSAEPSPGHDREHRPMTALGRSRATRVRSVAASGRPASSPSRSPAWPAGGRRPRRQPARRPARRRGHRPGHRARAEPGQPAARLDARTLDPRHQARHGRSASLLGASVVGYGTSLADLALMGALTGLRLGIAQALALPPGTRRWLWAAALPALWALGWTVTTLGGISMDQQFTVFGATAPITFSALPGCSCSSILPVPTHAGSTHGIDPERGTRMTTAPARHLRHRRDRPGHPRRARGDAARRSGWSTDPAPPGSPRTSRSSAGTRGPGVHHRRHPRAPGSSTRPSTRPTPSGPSSSPLLQAGVLAAAEAAGARLVSMENVYMYGRRPGAADRGPRVRRAHEEGQLRGRMAGELLAAHEAGRVEVAIGRASDYFGPRGGAQSNLGDRLFPAALAGKTATVLGDPDQPHTYTYIPDIGEGLAVLGEHPDAPGQIWHLPNDPDTRTTRQLVDIAYREAGQPRGRLRTLPAAAAARARAGRTRRCGSCVEMRYLFAEPFVVDSSKIADELGVVATPVEQALADDPGGVPLDA